MSYARWSAATKGLFLAAAIGAAGLAVAGAARTNGGRSAKLTRHGVPVRSPAALADVGRSADGPRCGMAAAFDELPVAPTAGRAGEPGASVAAPASGPRSRYRTLLKRIDVPADRASYGDFYDFGYWSGGAYAGHSNLPPGYWVYVAPSWSIYEDVQPGAPAPVGVPPPVPVMAAPAPVAPWSAGQAAGRPDTPAGGDVPTNWASATADGQREWLELTYDPSEVEAVGLLVHESCGPGAVDRVTATVTGGTAISGLTIGNGGAAGSGTAAAAGVTNFTPAVQMEVWAGADPAGRDRPSAVAVIAFKVPVRTARVRVEIDSPAVRGWNEIDAVGLIGKDGTVRWATAATASSTYGSAASGAPLELGR